MKQFIAILVFASAASSVCKAQSFLTDLQTSKQGEGTVTVKQSTDIDNLVNNAKLKSSQQQAAKTATEVSHSDNASHKASTTRQDEHKQGTVQSEHRQVATSSDHKNAIHEERSQQQRTADSDIVVDTSKKMMRNSYKVTGYRIQAFSGGNSGADREKAKRIGDAIKMKFPDQPVYVHFYSPRWICRVGNFRSYNEAANLLKSIKAMGYSQACIVKGKISVGY